MAGDEDSSKDEEYTDSLTSPTIASDSTTVEIPPSTAEMVEDNSNLQNGPTKSQHAPKMPYLGGSTPPDQTTDSVSIQQHSDSIHLCKTSLQHLFFLTLATDLLLFRS